MLAEQTFSGRVTRVISPTKTQVNEVFTLLLDPHTREDQFVFSRSRAVNLVADVYSFTDQPKTRAAVVYERQFQSSLTIPEVVAGFFAGNREKPASAEVDWIDGRDAVPMNDEGFWALVEGAGASRDELLIRLTEALTHLGDDEIFAFARCLAIKLHALDRPVDIDAPDLSQAPSLQARCAVVLAGRKVYETTLLSNGRLPEVEISVAELVKVPDRAFTAACGRLVHIVSSPNVLTGSNELWDTVRGRPSLVWTPELRQERLKISAGYDGITNPLEDAWYNAETAGSAFGGRFLVRGPQRFVETVVYLPVRLGNDPVVALAEAASSRAVELGGEVVAIDPVQSANSPPQTPTRVFLVTRRWVGDLASYLDKYVYSGEVGA